MKKVMVIGNSKNWKEIQKIQRDLAISGYEVYGTNLLGPREAFTTKQLKNVDAIMEEQLIICDIVYVYKEKYSRLDEHAAKLLKQAKDWDKIILFNGKLDFQQTK